MPHLASRFLCEQRRMSVFCGIGVMVIGAGREGKLGIEVVGEVERVERCGIGVAKRLGMSAARTGETWIQEGRKRRDGGGEGSSWSWSGRGRLQAESLIFCPR